MNVRTTILIIFSVIFLLPFVSHAESFERDLYIGSSGADVFALQKLLNSDQQTILASTGVGSPGFETEYFGSLTELAVKRFQEIHAVEVLHPIGLTEGTGYVGPLTRAKINSKTISIPPAEISEVSPFDDLTVDDALSIPEEGFVVNEPEELTLENIVELNNTNINETLSILRTVGKQQGYSSNELNSIEDNVRDIIEDLDVEDIEEFLQEGDSINPGATLEDVLTEVEKINQELDDVSSNPFTTLFSFLVPKRAYAQPGLLNPFGGKITAVIPCLCTPGSVTTSWVPVLGVKGGIFNYVTGTQAFLFYNLPLVGLNSLGKYTPTGAAMCLIPAPSGCITLPALGVITPVVGSNSIPLSI